MVGKKFCDRVTGHKVEVLDFDGFQYLVLVRDGKSEPRWLCKSDILAQYSEILTIWIVMVDRYSGFSSVYDVQLECGESFEQAVKRTFRVHSDSFKERARIYVFDTPPMINKNFQELGRR